MARITLAFRTERNYEVYFSLKAREKYPERRIEWFSDTKCEWRYHMPGNSLGPFIWTAFKDWRGALAWRV